MALRLAASSRNRAAITGVVAISPVLDWANTIQYAALAAHIPAWLAALAIQALRYRATSTLLGAPQPIRFEDLAWKRAPAPVLLLHSSGDRTAPYADSLAFQVRSPALVTLPQLNPVPHALEWNVDPERSNATSLNGWRAFRVPRRPELALVAAVVQLKEACGRAVLSKLALAGSLTTFECRAARLFSAQLYCGRSLSTLITAVVTGQVNFIAYAEAVLLD